MTQSAVVSAAASAPASRTRLWTRIVTVVVALLGAAAFVRLLCQFDGADVRAGLRSLGSLGPALLLLELGRMGCELIGTRVLLASAGQRLPLSRLARGLLLGQLLDVVMPAGRAAAEAAKAALYARDVGLPQAAAVGTALQLAALFANALLALAGYSVSTQLRLASALRIGLLGYAAAMCALVLGVGLFAAAPRVRGFFSRLPMLNASLERFSYLLLAAPRRLFVAVAAQLTGRALQALQLGLAASALGATPSLLQALLSQAVYLIGAALGDLVPAQLGTTDAAFVLAAPALALTPVAAFSITLALHAVQTIMAGISGVSTLALWWLESWQNSHGLLKSPAANVTDRSRDFG